MVKLILLDGVVELTEEQKQVLMKTPYFEALFLRWSCQEQEEYQVNLSINSIKFLFGEINQAEVLAQAAKQAVDHARQELDMIGASLNSIDLVSSDYPIDLYPFLQAYSIGRRDKTIVPDSYKTPDMYQIMFTWGK